MHLTLDRRLSNKEIEELKSQLNGYNYYYNNFADYFMLKIDTSEDISLPFEFTKHGDDMRFFSNIKYKNKKTTIEEIGKKSPLIIAGPCSIESEEQFTHLVKGLKDINIDYIRGGLTKPRSSVYSFQGLREEAIDYVSELKESNNFKFVSEVVSIKQIEDFKDVIDIYQVGTRNMYNYELLSALGKQNKPVLLKRGMSATIEEFLNAAEYIMAGGNPNVILCERGIRTFEQSYRNVLDINAVLYLKQKTHLPVVVDPSHACGDWKMVEGLSLAATAAGVDGLIIEVHDDPDNAISDGMQSITLNNFKKLNKKVELINELDL